MSRVRVLHVVVAGEIGGAERMLVDLATEPAQTGADHVIALMTPNPELATFFADAGLEVCDRGRVGEDPAAYLWRSLGPVDAAWLTTLMVRQRANVAHLHTFASQVLGTRAARRAKIPVLRTEHSTRAYVDPSCWPFSRWSLRRTTAVVAISAHIRDTVLSRAPWAAPMLRVIPNGVDLRRFEPAPPAPRSGAGTPTLRLALVGRLEPRKGIDLALETLRLFPAASLDIVGDGEERAHLEALAKGLGPRVVFHGRLPDVRPVLAASDAVLCTSREEGQGIALLEAMSMERPVISFPVGGVPEIVLSGVTGYLSRACTPESLAVELRNAAEDRARLVAMGRAARCRIVAELSVETMRDRYRATYRVLAR